MKRFLQGHATHPDWRMAMALAAAQIEAQRREPQNVQAPTLGWAYLSDAYAGEAQALLADLHTRWPGVEWVGATGVGVAASGVEYFDEPALSLMLADMPRDQFRVFSGARPLGTFAAHTAQVHADPSTADLGELIADMSARTDTGYLFGGLASSMRANPLHLADAALRGGLSGVAFGAGVALVSRVTQGCQPIGPLHRVTAAERNVITSLDDEHALDCLMHDLKLGGTEPRDALPLIRQTLVGLNDAPGSAPAGSFHTPARRGSFGSDTRVRHLIGLDPGRRGIAIADHAEVGMQLAFCTRNTEAARRDLMRICAEIREELEPDTLSAEVALARKSQRTGLAQGLEGVSDGSPALVGESRIAGAVYVSCSGRGGPHFGAPSAELAIVRHALGDVPLVGFFAAGEIARQHVYGYTGVLTVFLSD